ncbi:DUF6328 family protein [Anaeromyxobacter oryzisoli]|uniref:DUF6328 family protein n=1 Tax=Anaeromyxobacter oryzisoli TaxID=2925408 RepID=UPI001F59A3FB|nr:DUF6328 family protein [Anaeromyxobacter sp. SG63]
MASLSQKVQQALDEGRILVLGTQVLLGFEYRAFVERRFDDLPRWAQALKLLALCTMLCAFALIVLPAAFHRLVEGGSDSARLLRLTTRAVGLALLPLGVGLGLDLAVAAQPVLGAGGGLGFGAASAALALGCWYGWTGLARRQRGGRAGREEEDEEMAPTPLQTRISHTLTEARMLLPGAQALLGFQLAAVLADGFDRLPRAAQRVHLGAVALTVVTIVLLIAPAAYHRIVERGEETERVHRVASGLVVAALVPLALALSAQLGVVAYAFGRDARLAIALGVGAAAVLQGIWFGAPLALRARRARRASPRRAAARP